MRTSLTQEIKKNIYQKVLQHITSNLTINTVHNVVIHHIQITNGKIIVSYEWSETKQTNQCKKYCFKNTRFGVPDLLY